jgi:hypothetical protein
MARSTVQIQQPLGGLDLNYAYQSQPPFTLADALNCRTRDVFESRSRLGSRPGLVKAFSQNVSGVTPIESFTKDFVAAKDTSLIAASPDSAAYGITESYRVGRSGSIHTWRSVQYYNLTSIPTGAVVIQALLTLRIPSSNSAAGLPARVMRLTEPDWVETEATWNRASAALDWANGGAFTSTGEIGFTWPSGTNISMTLPIETLVQDALDSRNKHLHVLIKSLNDMPNDAQELVSLGSRESVTALHRPTLTVTYEVVS